MTSRRALIMLLTALLIIGAVIIARLARSYGPVQLHVQGRLLPHMSRPEGSAYKCDYTLWLHATGGNRWTTTTIRSIKLDIRSGRASWSKDITGGEVADFFGRNVIRAGESLLARRSMTYGTSEFSVIHHVRYDVGKGELRSTDTSIDCSLTGNPVDYDSARTSITR
jgi:hypothetical protein